MDYAPTCVDVSDWSAQHWQARRRSGAIWSWFAASFSFGGFRWSARAAPARCALSTEDQLDVYYFDGLVARQAHSAMLFLWNRIPTPLFSFDFLLA
jgi:hypothetical protein